jgi:hypothetical protein
MDAVKEYIAALEGEEQGIARYLYEVIQSTSPKFKTKLSYGVPYFSINYRVCFIWPSSSPLAIEKEGVQLGFCKGILLANQQGLLDMGKRKEVAIINYTQANQINENLVREILFEAIEVDELVHRERQNAKR